MYNTNMTKLQSTKRINEYDVYVYNMIALVASDFLCLHVFIGYMYLLFNYHDMKITPPPPTAPVRSRLEP